MERSQPKKRRRFPIQLMITDGAFSAYRRSLNRSLLAVLFATTVLFIGAASALAQLPSHLPPPSDPNSPSASAPPNSNDESGESSSVAPPPDSDSTSSSSGTSGTSGSSGDSSRRPAAKPADSGSHERNPEPPPGTTPPADDHADAAGHTDHESGGQPGAGNATSGAKPTPPLAPGESSSAVPDATRDPESESGNEPSTEPSPPPGPGLKFPWKKATPDSSAKNAADYNPLHAQESMDIGTFYMHKGDLSAAADRFKYAIQLQPNLAKPHFLLAKIAEKRGDQAAAIRYYQEYLAILPHAPDAKKVRSRIAELNKQLR
jgi:hypothetical protein